MATEYMVVREKGKVECYAVMLRKKKLVNVGLHSPDGFEMGYGGSGPADLALTILCEHLGVEPDADAFRSGQMGDEHRMAWDLHHAFKRKFIAPKTDRAMITSRQIDAFIAEEEK